MAKKPLTADDISEAIYALEETAKKVLLADIVSELQDFLKAGMCDGEKDTWVDGYKAAIETIVANF